MFTEILQIHTVYNFINAMASPLPPNIDPRLDSQLGELMDIPNPMKTEPDEASNAETGIATPSPDPSSWPYDDCWTSSRPIEPTVWA